MPRAGLNQTVVVDAAATFADAVGLSAVTITALADSLGVRQSAIYKHIDGLPGLHRELAMRGLDEANTAITKASLGLARGEALLATFEAYWRFAQTHPGLYEAMTHVQESEPELRARQQEFARTLTGLLRGYGLVGGEALHVARSMRAIVEGFVGLSGRRGLGSKDAIQASFRRTAHGFIEGLHQGQPNRVEEAPKVGVTSGDVSKVPNPPLLGSIWLADADAPGSEAVASAARPRAGMGSRQSRERRRKS